MHITIKVSHLFVPQNSLFGKQYSFATYFFITTLTKVNSNRVLDYIHVGAREHQKFPDKRF